MRIGTELKTLLVLCTLSGCTTTPQSGAAVTANPRSQQKQRPAQEDGEIAASVPTEAATATGAPSPVTAKANEPPRAKRQQIVDHLHGVDVQDPYRWLEDMSSPDSQAWLKGQDSYARRVLRHLPERTVLAKRISELSYLDMLNPPSRRGTRYFFSRQHADREKLVYYWQEGEDGDPRVLIDPNTLSKDGSVSVHDLRVSWDGRWVAYKVSRNASDTATLEVMEVATGKVSKIDRIDGARYADPSWTPENDGFYYTRLPVDPNIPEADLPGYAAVYFHRIGEDPRKDRLVHERTGDPKTAIAAEISRDGRFLFFYVQHGWNSTDIYYQDLRPTDAPKKTLPGSTPAQWKFKHFFTGQKAIANVVAWKGHIYVFTNWGASRYRIFKVDPHKIAREHWREIVPEHKTAVLEDFSLVGEHLALQYLEKATSRLEIVTLEGKRVRTVSFPGLGSASGLSGNPEDDTAYFSYSSFTTPWTVYRTSIRRGGRKVYFKLKAPVDPAPYQVEQVRYPSSDGTQVTMFIVRRKAARLDGTTPFILTGYGGFNINLTPAFSASRFAWLERGGGLAIPNLRGGGEYGETWHQAGMLKNKQHSFDDFIAAARFLIDKRYTSPERLAIVGGSNGGLLVGAAMTQRPDLFRAVSCHVPLLDMVRYHLFGAGKIWITEYGSSDDPEQFQTLFAYSPYHRLKPGTAYPALLVLSADSDDRVDPMHARKFTAAVQHATSSGRPVLLRVESNAGHRGGDMIKKRVELAADEYAFLMHELGMDSKARQAAE